MLYERHHGSIKSLNVGRDKMYEAKLDILLRMRGLNNQTFYSLVKCTVSLEMIAFVLKVFKC